MRCGDRKDAQTPERAGLNGESLSGSALLTAIANLPAHQRSTVWADALTEAHAGRRELHKQILNIEEDPSIIDMLTRGDAISNAGLQRIIAATASAFFSEDISPYQSGVKIARLSEERELRVGLDGLLFLYPDAEFVCVDDVPEILSGLSPREAAKGRAFLAMINHARRPIRVPPECIAAPQAGKYAAYYDNGSGYYDCSCVEDSMNRAVQTVTRNWQTQVIVMDDADNVVWHN